MRPPCEFLQSALLTGMRNLIALSLKKQNTKKFSQANIAEILNISQPVIHNYLKLSKEEILERYPLLREQSVQNSVARIVEEIVNGTPSSQLINHICFICYLLRVRGPICMLHQQILPLEQDCQLCLPSKDIMPVDPRMKVIQALEEAAKEFISLEFSITLIPEIGTQFAYACDTSPLERHDIAAFPGRIIKVGDRGRIVSPSTFKASKTSSSILMTFREHNHTQRSIICIKNTEKARNYLKNRKDAFLILTEYGDRNWPAILSPLMPDKPHRYIVIADKGGVGFESLIYILGKNPQEILLLLKELK
ncbi:MAG: thiamine-phosphate synthase family protein [Promethearchaeota archaeon]